MEPLLNKDLVWIVTGASKGIGLLITKRLIEAGYYVVATSRSKEQLDKQLLPSSSSSDRLLTVQVDLASQQSVEQDLIKPTLERFKKIDIVINNAGYGVFGSIEDATDKISREMFDINLFGALNVMRTIAPLFREQKSGYLFNTSSIGGFIGLYGGGIYCASKFALDGATEAFASEMKEFNVRTTLLNLGFFQSEFTNSAVMAPNQHECYLPTIKAFGEMERPNPGDGTKLANVLIDLVHNPSYTPLHLFGGADACSNASTKIEALQKDIEFSKKIASNLGIKD